MSAFSGEEEEGFRRFCTAVATDMGYYDDSVRDHLLGLDAALIEANHDRGMLANGPYPMYLKRRIMSREGHLSNNSCGRLLSEIAGPSLKQVLLGHLSRDNNTPKIALDDRPGYGGVRVPGLQPGGSGQGTQDLRGAP